MLNILWGNQILYLKKRTRKWSEDGGFLMAVLKDDNDFCFEAVHKMLM